MNLDAPTALAHLRIAEERYAHAAESERAVQQNLPRPPRINARAPAADRVSAHRNEAIEFSVDASDPNGDPLSYADGRRRAARFGASFSRTSARRREVAVSVSDGRRQRELARGVRESPARAAR